MPYFTAVQIEAEMTALAAAAPALCAKTVLPNPTVSEGVGPTTYSYLKVANGSGAGRVAVLAVGGMHAREWAQPDAVISFAKALIAAYQGSAAFVIPAYTDAGGNTYGPVTVPAATIKQMVDRMDILLLPLANPDGRAFAMAAAANKGWRKNRAPRTVPANPATAGVDLNRNFDIAWDYDLFFNAAFAGSTALSASKNAADDRFIGKPLPAPNSSHPNSEPEVRNLIWILDHHPVTYSVDLHSYSMLVMHPWGIEQNGTVPAQNFRNSSLDHTRDGTLGTAYSEYFPNVAPPRLLDRHKLIVGSIRDGIRAVTGRSYIVGGIADTIYPATGSFTDFHFSRQFNIAASPPIHAFAAEFGDAADNFQPLYSDPHGFPRIEREVHALLLRLLQAALPPPPAATGSGGGSSKCIFSMAAADLIAGTAWLDTLRRGRAALLGGRRTRGAMLVLDGFYRRLGNSLFPHVAGRRWVKRAIAYGLVAPSAGLTALALKWSAR
ncbi:M14 family zinc carboxypeptidase [Mesorhizobium sp. WSM2561]|uniref:M14 family zinc carboxypeptidase n=1 Tax=Mesorhizobium sp. WSM2561 TaxID=1040985 RepID=UPI000483E51D|nr:M14 family zinc carboxypeptidase [Mesorhizobium sp. WSM2561]